MDWLQELAAVVRVDQVALAGLVTATVILILRGNLVPRSVLDDRTKERDAWKNAYMESEKARGVLVSQNGELLEVARTANHILRSLPGGDSGVGTTTQSPTTGTIH